MSVMRSAHADASAPAALTPKQRATLVLHSATSPAAAMAMDDAEFNADFFLAQGITARSLRAAKLTPQMLKQRGATSARVLRQLGYDALDLTDATFCANCIAVFGAADLLAEFMQTAADAVAVAGSSAARQLGLDVGTLLVLCAGAPVEAQSVIAQTPPRGGALQGVAAATLLDTGLRGGALRGLGYTASSICAQTMASATELEQLGL